MTVLYEFIDRDSALADISVALADAAVIAVDTEFMRTDTFYPIPALLQLSDGVKVYLVDPLAIDNWQPLNALLTNPGVYKVMHSVSEDMEVFQRLLGLVPQPLLDTQVGAALAGLDSGGCDHARAPPPPACCATSAHSAPCPTALSVVSAVLFVSAKHATAWVWQQGQRAAEPTRRAR